MLTPLTKQGYVNHVHVSTPDSNGNVYLAITHERSDQPGNPTRVEIVQCSPGGTLEVIFTFDETTYGKAGFSGITPLPNGDLFYCGSHRAPDQVQEALYGTLHRGPDGWQLL